LTNSEKEKIRAKILDGSIYNEPEYVKWRQKVFERDRFTCQLSGEPGGHLEAHHIKPKFKYPELIYDVSNGITLRKYMHNFVHGKGPEKFEKKFQDLAKKNKAKKRIKKVTKKIKAMKGLKRKKKALRRSE
jgi:5-methylcytosine-specific restriction endonuclease McrA